MDGTLRQTINAAKKYVVSNTLGQVDWNAELVRGDLSKAVKQLNVVPPESWRASLCGFPVGGRGVLVVDRAHHARRAVPAVVVVEPVAPVQHDGLGLAGVLEVVA